MKKKLIVTFCLIIALIGATTGSFFIFKAINSSISTVDFLVSGHEWKKSGEETVVWAFESDGTCKITTNSTEFFDCNWFLEGNNLTIKTAWLTDLTDDFEIVINESAQTFTVTSKSDGKISTFML